MKIPKVLTICFVLCCLFAGNVFAVSEPCVDITKEVCPYSKVGDTINYTITIENCGDVDLELITVVDSLVGDITAFFPPFLSWGETSTSQVPYLVQQGDLDPLINEVTVTAEPAFDGVSTFNGGIGVTATAIAEVDLLHPDFTLDVECLLGPGIPNGGGSILVADTPSTNSVGGYAAFQVILSNIGDIELDIQVDCLGAVSRLSPGETAVGIIEIPLVGGSCGTGGSAELTCCATATIPPEYCELPNVLERCDTDICETPPCEPSFTVEKTCLTSPAGGDCALQPGDNAEYEIVITNTSLCEDPGQPLDLYFEIDDEHAGNLMIPPIPAGDTWTEIVEVPVPDCPSYQTECVDLINTVTVEGFCVLTGEPVGIVEAVGVCEYSCRPPEGCTPGFWKNHPDCWCDSYTPQMLVSDVFTSLQAAPYDTVDDDDRKSDFDQDTLLDALKYRGGRGLAGSVRNMLRHATAALLNGCSSDVAYPVSDALVIDLVNWALDSQDIAIIQDAHMLFAMWNEDSPCPIDAHCRRIDDEVNGD